MFCWTTKKEIQPEISDVTYTIRKKNKLKIFLRHIQFFKVSMDAVPGFCLVDGHGQEAEQQGVETKGFYSPAATGWQI